jgi:hypothetical protein
MDNMKRIELSQRLTKAIRDILYSESEEDSKKLESFSRAEVVSCGIIALYSNFRLQCRDISDSCSLAAIMIEEVAKVHELDHEMVKGSQEGKYN